jgi:hypothetical protein
MRWLGTMDLGEVYDDFTDYHDFFYVTFRLT